MLKYYLSAVALSFHLLWNVFAGSKQTCGKDYKLSVTNPTRLVKCRNPGNIWYECEKWSCHTKYGWDVDKTLWFKDCQSAVTNKTYHVVWPTYFSAVPRNRSLYVYSGTYSEKPDTKHFNITVNDFLVCIWKRWFDRNAMRPDCQNCTQTSHL
ncbi:hypothetical protein O181_003493 [Austropuccinia psidii MF-1]|uniref:Uncharacterized protein n=1 Tax=Austropuccinia psidii MF-1 TaxID=1389203 RepID=A0A9Q3GDM0_9BASI|nr:hypothetical protein [Austropuccinia psidii MF-1]